MQSMDFDRCLAAAGAPEIWMVREKSKSRVLFPAWEDYVAAGKPPYEVVAPEELEEYRIVKQFRPLLRE